MGFTACAGTHAACAGLGVTGTLEDKPVLVRLIAQHESIPVTVQQVVEAAREMRALDAQSLILCLTAPPRAKR